MNDVVVNKIQSVQRCIARAREEYKTAGKDFATNVTHQDAAVLNITRACESTIDLANHLIKTRKLGIPTAVLCGSGPAGLAREGTVRELRHDSLSRAAR